MPLREEKFDQGRIDTLKRFLQREMDKNHPRDYEILVDDFKVVSRTNNLDEFEDYEPEIRDNTRSVSFLIYDGPNTPRNTRHTFLFHVDTIGKNGTLAGLGEIDQVIAQRLEERERDYELQRVKEKLTATEQKLDEAEEYADQLERKIKDMEDKRYTTAISMGELASAVLKGIVRQNVEKIPGGHALAGLLGAELPEQPAVNTPAPAEVTASFEKAPVVDLPEATRDRLSLIEQMQQKFNEQEMIAVFAILDSLAVNPSRINGVIEFLGIQTTPHQALAA